MTTSETPVESTSEIATGYVLGMKYGDERGWRIDWGSQVFSTLEAALTGAKRANGEEWTRDVERLGYTEANVSSADYLPFALIPVALPVSEQG